MSASSPFTSTTTDVDRFAMSHHAPRKSARKVGKSTDAEFKGKSVKELFPEDRPGWRG